LAAGGVWAVSETVSKLGWMALEDYPSFERIQGMPNAYIGRSKDGLYMPMKLDQKVFKWRDLSSDFLQANSGYYEPLNQGGMQDHTALQMTIAHANVGTDSSGFYPFVDWWDAYAGIYTETTSLGKSDSHKGSDVRDVDFYSGTPVKPRVCSPELAAKLKLGKMWIPSREAPTGDLRDQARARVHDPGDVSTALVGDPVPEFCNGQWGDISFRNMSVATSLVVYIRVGFEVQVRPQSSLAPYLKLSPAYDAQALDAYFMISRELKDAFPASYNDANKIWSVISSVAKAVAPVLSPFASWMSMGIKAAANTGDAIAAAVNRSRMKDMGSVASASDKEIVRTAREAAQAADEVGAARRPRPKPRSKAAPQKKKQPNPKKKGSPKKK